MHQAATNPRHHVRNEARSGRTVAPSLSSNGQSLKIALKDGGVMIDNAKDVKADILTTNGVIHVIDTVVLPAK